MAGRTGATAGRVFFTAQAGRGNQGHKLGNHTLKKEDEWGISTSQSEFRGYEPAEIKNARANPSQTRPALESSLGRGTQPKSKSGPLDHTWHRYKESFPDHSAMSAYTASEQSGKREQAANKLPDKMASLGPDGRYKPEWAVTADRPMPEHSFDHLTLSQHENLFAKHARHTHFPYRDENVPRSKRMLHDLAENKCSQNSVASGSTCGASQQSSFSVAKSLASGRSRSETSVASSHHTADTQGPHCKVVTGIRNGNIARRRKENTFRSPGLWPADAEWLQNKWDTEGPCGLTFGNFKRNYYGTNCKQEVEQAISIGPLLSGLKESEVVR